MDELYVVQPSYDLGALEFEPPNLQHPGTLQNFLTAGAFGAYFVLGRITGVFASVQDFKGLYWTDPTGFYVVARLLVVAFALATVWLVYRLGTRLADQRTGLIAALILALAPVHVSLSRLALKGVPLAFFVAAVLLFCEAIARHGRKRDYAIVGALLGCAMAVKYSAIVLVVPIAVAHWVRLSQQKRPVLSAAWRAVAGPSALLAAGATIAAFMVTCPYTISATQHWWNELMFQIRHQGHGHFGYEPSGNGWWYYLDERLASNVTWPVVLAALAGIVVDVRRRRRASLVMLSFFLAYWLIMGASKVSFHRYCLPHLPALAIYASIALVSAVAALTQPVRHKWMRMAVVAGVGVLVLGTMVWTSARKTVGYMAVDSRLQAARWIQAHSPPGARWIADWQGPHIEDPAIEIRGGKAAPYADILAAVADKGARFATVSAYTRHELSDPHTLRVYPELCREYVRLIHWLDAEACVLKVFPGSDGLGRGPKITIYQLNPDRLRATRQSGQEPARDG